MGSGRRAHAGRTPVDDDGERHRLRKRGDVAQRHDAGQARVAARFPHKVHQRRRAANRPAMREPSTPPPRPPTTNNPATFHTTSPDIA